MLFTIEQIPNELAGPLLPLLRDAEEGEERIRAALRASACAVYAALIDHEVIGAAVVRWEKDEDSELLYLAVAEPERGKGYGKRLVAAIQAALPAHGRALLVGTANSSLENIAFYQHCGFRMFEIRRDFFLYVQPPLQDHGIVMRDMIVFRYELDEPA